MRKITAVLHTHNDALRLGRALQSLRPCDEVLLIDGDSDDETSRVAREYGALIKRAIPGVTPGAYAMDATYDWILCIRPNESLSDDLEADLFEWKNQELGDGVAGYRVGIREQEDHGWRQRPPEVRLVNRKLVNWLDEMPPNDRSESTLSGDLLCFHLP